MNRVKWYDGHEITYSELIAEQDYFTNKIEYLGKEVLGIGVVDEGKLTGDTSMEIENNQPATTQVRDDATITIAPGDTAIYAQKFAAAGTNIQLATLRLRATAGWDGVLEVSIYELQTATDPSSAVDTGSVLGTLTLSGAEIPATKQNITVDFSYSGTNDISETTAMTKGSYYAIGVRRIGGSLGSVYVSYSQVRGSTTSYGVKISGTEYDLSGGALSKSEALYFQIYYGAIDIETGLAYINGRRVSLASSDTTRQNLSLINFTVGAANYVVVEPARTDATLIQHPRTQGTSVYTRETDAYTATVLNFTEWDNYDRTDVLLLGTFTRASYTRTKVATISGSSLLTITDSRSFIPFTRRGASIDQTIGGIYEDFGFGTTTAVEAGDVVMVVEEGGVTGIRLLDTASGSYTGYNIFGVVKEVLLDSDNEETGYVVIVMAGIVETKVESYTIPTSGSQAIQVGDIMVASASYDGRVRKEGTPDEKAKLGKALGSLTANSTGTIDIFVTL